VFVVFLILAWRGTRLPRRPANISSRGAFLEVGVVPFKFFTHGDWLDCWKDVGANMDRCKYTDEKGNVYFEDYVLPYEGVSPVSEDALVIDTERTKGLHYGVTDKNSRFPLIILQNGQILLPQSDYEWGRKIVDFYVMHKNTDQGMPRR
jgi:hypothetical protein